MSYKYNVFLSYRRRGEWPQWVRDIFYPLLDHWLGEELGRDAGIFFDQMMESGSAWPYELAPPYDPDRPIETLTPGRKTQDREFPRAIGARRHATACASP